MVAKFVRARDEDRSLRAPGIGVTSREEKKKKVKTRQSLHQKQRQEEDGQLLYNWEKGTHHSIILYAAKVCHKHKANKDFFSIHKKAGSVYHKPALQDVKRNPPGRMKRISCRNVDLDKKKKWKHLKWQLHGKYIRFYPHLNPSKKNFAILIKTNSNVLIGLRHI